MYRIITIEREYGSGGAAIASRLAEQLHWRLWDQSLTEEIAKIAQVDCRAVERCDEKVDSTLYRLAKVFWRGSYERSLPVEHARVFDTDCMVAEMQKVMERIAQEGQGVVVGRGAPYFLRERSDVFHVFTYAPRAEKIRRLRELGKSESEAAELVDTIDRERIAFVKHYFGADWPTRSLYHLMINTVIGDDNVIATILETMQRLEEAARPQAVSR